MTHAQAISIVLKAAEQNANGHGQCVDILRAVKIVREILNVAAPEGMLTESQLDKFRKLAVKEALGTITPLELAMLEILSERR